MANPPCAAWQFDFATMDEALANAREAIEVVLEHRAERGQPIPDGDAPFVHQVKVSLQAAA